MENRRVCGDYEAIAKEIIQTEDLLSDIANSKARIVYLSSDKDKHTKDKTIFAECEKVQDKNKWSIPADYTITVYEPNTKDFTPEQMRILLFHELLHIEITFKPDGTEVYSVRDHDYADFKVIIDRYGTKWNQPKQ